MSESERELDFSFLAVCLAGGVNLSVLLNLYLEFAADLVLIGSVLIQFSG